MELHRCQRATADLKASGAVVADKQPLNGTERAAGHLQVAVAAEHTANEVRIGGVEGTGAVDLVIAGRSARIAKHRRGPRRRGDLVAVAALDERARAVDAHGERSPGKGSTGLNHQAG